MHSAETAVTIGETVTLNNSDTEITPSEPCSKWIWQNNSANSIRVALDVSTATGPFVVLASGASWEEDDVVVSTFHVLTPSGAIAINSSLTGLCFMGWR